MTDDGGGSRRLPSVDTRIHERCPQCAPWLVVEPSDLPNAFDRMAVAEDAVAFARFGGAAPIPCGSGRHRLHRCGKRQLNAALYRIAIFQQRHHPVARYSSSVTSLEGETARDARRALERHLANVTYRASWSYRPSSARNISRPFASGPGSRR
jgi:hypothetical protein